MDNTAPTVGKISFSGEHALGDWDHVQGSTDGNPMWTNAQRLTASWDRVERDGGSPIDTVKYDYQPGPTCGAHRVNLGDGAATSVVLKGVEPQAPGCTGADNAAKEQGRHQVTVWARDLVGNEENAPPYSSSAAWHWDNRAPELSGPAKLTVVPGTWVRVNRFKVAVDDLPVYDEGAGESPTARVEYTIGSSTVRELATCADGQPLVSGKTDCVIGSIDAADATNPNPAARPITVPRGTGGVHPVTVWTRDLAGNSSREESAHGSAWYDDGYCVKGA